MQNGTIWRALLAIEKTVLGAVEFDEDEQLLVAHVGPGRRAAGHTYAFDELVAWLAIQCQDRDHLADGDRLADCRRDHHPGLGRRRGRP